jgi:hypothetical protein
MSKDNSACSIQIGGGGITVGMVIAAILSWQHNHDFLWAIVHGILSWLYVFYYLLTYGLQ